MSKQVILTRGLPASGKSTWAKEQLTVHPGRYKIISKDALRLMLDNGKWTKHNEQFILQSRDALILATLDAGYSPIVDDTNLHPKHEQHIRELVKGKAQVDIQDFTYVSIDTCIERDKHRANYVGEQTIRRMYRQFLAPSIIAPIYSEMLPDAVICDMDGTLALLNGRNPYDASTCENDLLNEPVAGIVKLYYSENVKILLVSGRKEVSRSQSERWLQFYRIPYDELWMRSNDDNRKDSIIKQEIYEREIKEKYNIRFVLDDRSSVVSLWRQLGLTCLQVAEGDF